MKSHVASSKILISTSTFKQQQQQLLQNENDTPPPRPPPPEEKNFEEDFGSESRFSKFDRSGNLTKLFDCCLQSSELTLTPPPPT